jgi:cytochrome c556
MSPSGDGEIIEMKHGWVVGACAALLVAVPTWVAFASQAVVDDRIVGMKSLIGTMRGATGASDPAEARENLAKAISYAKSIPGRFPKGTGQGDAGISITRAKQDIWMKPAVFKAEADGFVAALEAASAAAGDAAAFDAAMASVRKSCSSCHDAFRGPAVD